MNYLVECDYSLSILLIEIVIYSVQ